LCGQASEENIGLWEGHVCHSCEQKIVAVNVDDPAYFNYVAKIKELIF
jgi:hypothetical protein